MILEDWETDFYKKWLEKEKNNKPISDFGKGMQFASIEFLEHILKISKNKKV